MVVFQAVSWEGKDTDDNEYTITIYGRTADGRSVSATTNFEPYFFIKVPPGSTDSQVWSVILKIGQSHEVEYKARYELVQMKELWGFTNSKMCAFMKVYLPCLSLMRRLAAATKFRSVAGLKLKVYEANIDPVLRFMHITGVQSTGWLEATGDRVYLTTCDIDIFVGHWKTIKPVENDSIAPFRISSFDIESYSSTGKFPDADVPGDAMFQIAFTTKVYGSDKIEQHCLCYKKTNADNCTSFATEKELLDAVQEYIIRTDPDILTGWNIFGFDLEYLYKRMLICKCDPETFCMGRRREHPCILTEKNLSSSALGQNVLKMLPMSGRYTFDLFQTIKAEHKLESYSLNNVSLEFLGDKKNDMPIKELFSHFETGDPDKLGEVAEYCIKDTELPIRLMEKLYTVENLIEMAKATWVPLSFLSERGQQIKVFSQIAKKARELRFAIPMLPKNDDPVQYEGATVLEAQTGAYYEPITALDFESLYPSIMVAHNLCYSTLVMNPKYDNLPGVEYETHGDHRFAQNVPSLLPAILSDLKLFRKKAKADMAKAKGTPMYHVYNGKQLAYKISMNSVYGFTGASKGMLPCVAIASTVTSQGRTMIQQSKEYVEAHFPGSQVRYGDSVMPGTPVIIRKNGIVKIEKIEDLGNSWAPYPGIFAKDGSHKESIENTHLEAWTHDGWKPIHRVIRHKCKKKIWRVVTHTGVVDVTEDHSLLDENLNLVKPGDVMVNEKLYHSFPTQHYESHNHDLFIYGMFVGDGSCGEYDCPSGKKYSWAINNKDIELLDKCKNILEHMYPDLKFVIMDTLESSGVYKLSPRGKITSFVKHWRYVCYDGKSKKVPEFAMGNSTFLDGLWASDGCRQDYHNIGCRRIDTKNQITAQWYYMYLRSLGYNVSINTRIDKPAIFRLTFSNSKFRKDESCVKKIHVLHDSWDGYVYDIETEAGTFQAGVGQLIVKNTDSIMVQFDTGGLTGLEAIEYSWGLGEKAAGEITKLFKSPNNLELEKIYCPYFLYSKKRYAAKMWVMGKTGMEMEKIDIKGLQVIRRDNCQFVRDVCQDVINMILDSSDPTAPIEYANQKARELKSGHVPMQKLMLSKRLGDSYKSSNLAHVAVRDKIRERAPGSEPLSGDRVQFVIVDTGDKKHKMYQKAEDPNWVESTKLKLDYDYYLKHQFENPVRDLLEPLTDFKLRI
jgi:DNA polymerase delta subunit 1